VGVFAAMASSLGSGSKGSVNIELNIVPFIDVMSCLTAFLLVTAAWVNVAHLRNEPQKGGEATIKTEPPWVGVLIEADDVQVTSYPERTITRIPRGEDYGWAQLETTLKDLKTADPVPVMIAAVSSDAHPIAYQSLIAAMDTAVKAGFPDVGVTDPAALAK
jgi:biopolymer transport protein ExbD